MSENNSSVNEETKNVIKGVAPPEPKLLGTYINMVPISESDTSKLVNHKLLDGQILGAGMMPENVQVGKTGNCATTTNIPTSQFPMSAMNMEQLQQFMMRMQINTAKDQTAVAAANPSLGLGLSSGIPAQTLGAALNVNNMIPSSTTSSYNIPPVGALDPNILASLGLNVQKPTLQPIQFPNMQAGVPNLCGIQGQDMNLATWMQKQKIALALSELQNNTQPTSGDNSVENKSSSPPNSLAAPQNPVQPTNTNSLGSFAGISEIPGVTGVPGSALITGATPATQSQLTPQLAAFLGNPNLIPSKDAGLSQTTAQISTAGMNIPGMNLGVGTAPNMGNVVAPESIVPNMFQPTTDMSKIEAMIKQQQQQFISNQLNAAAQLLRQHGIQATVGTEPLNNNSEIDISKSKKPALLQKIVASKINPKIFIVPNALNQDECDEIISLIQNRLEDSKISISRKENNKSDNEETEGEKEINNESPSNKTDTQEKVKDEEKTQNQDEDEDFCRSATACIQPEETPLIREIENRLGLLVESSNLHMEPILVHRYSTNDYIKEHHDGDTRTYTISVFLSDVENGGELDFPYAGIKVKPKKGLAVVWPNIDSQGKLDYTTVHAVNKINQEVSEKECLSSTTSSYLLYLHINKEPVRLGFEASQAMQQVVQSETPKTDVDPKVIAQVTYPMSEDKKTKE
ncbi:prolyl 4-hydroxylase alpha subunit [Cryptosporidium ubiquitum]|uniref:Prolyl 4-hydroxylase alpha subunit n=1 Tax=Cryptosporidium ubiquitum TaxID=857276 RepID=A0A1J4MJF3_9CRYT|nr:prolyl 4-hydroxylase alpha subunit [Cryptosporidium ubiquitum]OII74353.1 prolyl 4-hydroxylase alpha subunit [Cryptosporidium ubiquitum]